MKFHCDRCNTRYSISAERVRGKILKIRCKNCSAVITVREDMSVGDAEAVGSLPQAMPAAPQAARPKPPAAAATPFTEWYLAQDGAQEGPMSQEAAERWIRGRDASAELFCWADGWGDWQPVESIPAFLSVRQSIKAKKPPAARPPAPAASGGPSHAPTATLDFAPGVLASGNDLQLDIDEASRVVRLPLGPADIGTMAPMFSQQNERAKTVPSPPSFDMPGVVPAEMAAVKPKKNFLFGVAVSLIVLLLSGLTLVLVIASRERREEMVATRSSMADENLGRDYRAPERRVAQQTSGDSNTRGQTRRAVTRAPEVKPPPIEPTASVDPDMVALPGGNSNEIIQGNLDPDAVTNKAKKSNILFTRCHERALKADPLLEIPKAVARVTIAPSGKVSEVSIPGLETTPLGTCLITAMRGWKFQQSTEGLVTQMTITFGR